MTIVADLVAFLRADAGQYVAGTKEAIGANDALVASQEKVASSMTAGAAAAEKAVASHTKMLSVATEVGHSLEKFVTVPILAAGAASVELSMKFDESFAHVASASKLPAAALASLRNDVLNLAEATAQSPTHLAETLVSIERSGVGAAQATNVLTVSAKLAATNLATQANAADVLTSVMNAYGPAVISAARAGDILATGAESSKLSVDDLSSSLGRALPAAAALHVSFQDLVTAEAVMSKEGLSAGQAGMSLFRILSSIENPTSKGAAAMQAFGLSIGDAKKMVEDGDFIGLLKKIGENSAGNEQALLQLTGGIRGASGAFALSAQSGKALEEEQKKMAESTGSLNDLMGKVAGTAGFQLRQALYAVESALIRWGDAFSGPAKGLADLIKAGADVISFVGKLNPELKDIVVLFLAAAASLGPLILIGGAFAKGVLAIVEAQKLAVEWATRKAAADEIAGDAAADRAGKEALLTGALDSQVGSQEAATGVGLGGAATRGAARTVATGAEDAAVGGGEIAATSGLGAALGAYAPELASLAPAGAEATSVFAGLAAAVPPVAAALAAAAAVGGIFYLALKTDKYGADAATDSVKDLTKAIEEYGTASKSVKNQDFAKIGPSIQAAVDEMRTAAAARAEAARQAASGHMDEAMTAGIAAQGVGGSGLPVPEELTKTHDALQQVIKDQGTLAVRPFFKELMDEARKIPGAMAVVKPIFQDIANEINAVDSASKRAAAAFAQNLGVSAAEAAHAVSAYDAALGNTTNLTQQAIDSGRQAAIILQNIGVAAIYAAQTTQNGMSTMANAVAGAVAQMNASLSSMQQTDSLASSLLALHDAKAGTGGGGGGGSGGQTPQAAAVDHTSKELAYRDALLAVARGSQQVMAAQTQLAQARQSQKEALEGLDAAEQNYRTILTGVLGDQRYATEAAGRYLEVLHAAAPGSVTAADAQTLYNRSLQEAKDDATAAAEAVISYARAQNDAVSATLSLHDAQRTLAQTKNDAPLAGFAVADAKRQLATDMAGGGTLHYVQTPTGSKMEGDGGLTGAAKAEQIAKDKIALRDAEIAASAQADNLKKAQIGVSNATLDQKQKTIDLTKAHQAEKDTLDGYAKSTDQARSAIDQLTTSQINAVSAAQGVTTAQNGVVDAMNAIATNENNAQRALFDLQGKLTVAGGAAHTAAQKMNDVATAEQTVLQNAKDLAKGFADSKYNALTQPQQWAEVFSSKLKDLMTIINPSGQLATWLQNYINLFHELATMDLNQASTGTIHSWGTPDWAKAKPPGQALGGPVSPGIEYWVGENGPERFVPSTMGTIEPTGAGPGGGRGSGRSGAHTTIVQNYYVTATALDAQSVAPVVVEALREETRNNGGLSGVRTLS